MLTKGLNNWKLRLILSALLCIMGLSAMISMILGLLVQNLTVYDQSLVAIAIFMVGIPAYLIISGLSKIDEYTIASFLNERVLEFQGKAELLAKDKRELDDDELQMRSDFEKVFDTTPVHKLLPDKPVKQAYLLMLLSICISFYIWYFTT